MIRPLIRFIRRIPRRVLIVLLFVVVIEPLVHVRRYQPTRPSTHIDLPFQTQCNEPDLSAPRANATMVMLAQNDDLEGAVQTVRSIETRFNHWYHYPIVFLNDNPWSTKFIKAVSEVASGDVYFDVVPRESWTYPDWMDLRDAEASMLMQEADGVPYSGTAGYHHMCRFFSGKFYDLERLSQFKWFWRIEPDVEYTCSITYDPFVEMERHGKKMGYTIALWEVGKTAPSLFRATSEYKASRGIKSTELWNSMIDASWAPWPIRRLLGKLLSHRDSAGDAWSLCHFWNNFEIADMDFFRSEEYRDFFDYLDNKGGFYFERWGDAPIHSLAAALFLEPGEIHHFEDFGYMHPPFGVCPANAPGGQLENSKALGGVPARKMLGSPGERWAPEREGGIGCRCECDGRKREIVFNPECMRKLGKALKPRG